MTWIKLDASFPDHPKIEQVGPEAAWLYIAGLCYCSRLLTDGRIPKKVIKRLTTIKRLSVAVSRLLAAGLWTEEGDNYCVHDYLDYQISAGDVAAKRAAGKAGGLQSGRSRREARASSKPRTDVDTDLDIPPNPPHSGGPGSVENPRANGTNPRALAAAKRKAEAEAKAHALATEPTLIEGKPHVYRDGSWVEVGA